jgi:hypothetical protein
VAEILEKDAKFTPRFSSTEAGVSLKKYLVGDFLE